MIRYFYFKQIAHSIELQSKSNLLSFKYSHYVQRNYNFTVNHGKVIKK